MRDRVEPEKIAAMAEHQAKVKAEKAARAAELNKYYDTYRTQKKQS